jgi:hypothetical protein
MFWLLSDWQPSATPEPYPSQNWQPDPERSPWDPDGLLVIGMKPVTQPRNPFLFVSMTDRPSSLVTSVTLETENAEHIFHHGSSIEAPISTLVNPEKFQSHPKIILNTQNVI